jgi:hypothetical protein
LLSDICGLSVPKRSYTRVKMSCKRHS